MNTTEIKTIIQQELPSLIANDPLIRDFILRTVSEYYSPKSESDQRFDRILNELARDREEQARKWDENNRRLDALMAEQNQKWEDNRRQWDESNRRLDALIAEQNQKWDENNRRLDALIAEQNQKWDENNRRLDALIAEQNQKWDENNRKWQEQQEQNKAILVEIQKLHKKHDSTIGALGSRWGLYSEASFRNALKGILEDSFGVEVLNINDFDDQGEVFGRPDQVEIDVIIKNGLTILCEIKSSMSKSEMYTFDRKVEFYRKRHQREVNRKLVISPMVNDHALVVAKNLGIEVFSYGEDVTDQ